MTQELPVDPELRELLETVACDERAKLFRTEIPRPTRLVLTDVPHVSLRAAGLTSAEREILRVYREDVAKLLRDAAEWKIQQDPLGAAETSVYSTPTLRNHYADAHELLASLDARTDGVERFSIPNTIGSTARTGRSLLAAPQTGAHQLAGLSLRLVPHDAAWIHIGRSLLIDKQLEAAAHAFAEVVRRRQSPDVLASAWTCLGATIGCSNRHEDAARAYREATAVGEPDPNMLLSSFGESVLAGNASLALESAERVDAALPSEAPGLVHWCDQLKLRLQLSPLVSQREGARGLMRELVPRIGLGARRVLNELL